MITMQLRPPAVLCSRTKTHRRQMKADDTTVSLQTPSPCSFCSSRNAFSVAQKGNECMCAFVPFGFLLFFMADLSVSWLSSHNKSPPLS